MKQTLAVLMALIIFLQLDITISAETQQAETDQVIVLMEEKSLHPLENGEVIPVEGQDSQLVSVKVPENETVESFMEELEKRSDIEKVEPDHKIKLAYTANDSYVSLKQYHHQTIGTMRAWDKTLGSTEVVVAVIDDGVDMLHTDLEGKFVSPYDVVKKSNTAIPTGAHGTHVAGIIGSSIDNQKMGAGIAPRTSIMPINVFNGEYAYTSDVILGINYAVENGADIINMSLWTEEPSEALETAVQSAHENGVVMVAAAGNNGKSEPNYPAAYPEVISVGSTTANDELSSFSNYGPTIDITAPGSSIQSTLPGDSFGEMSGTSMASPVVAGVAALVLADDPKLTNLDIEKRLYETAKDLGAPGKDDFFGNGRVNAKDALLLPPAIPEVDEVSDQSNEVIGKAEVDAAVTVKRGETVLGTGTATAEETFGIAILKQKAGTKLTITAENRFGKVEKEVFVVDVTPPEPPLVISLYHNATSIVGKAELESTVSAYAGNKEIGKAAAIGGNFMMKIPRQTAGTTVSVVAKDAAGNKSPAAKITVADGTVKVAATAYNKLKVSWAQVAGANGYEIYRSASGSGTYSKISTVTNGKTLSYINSGLATGKTYHYKVRAYRMADGGKVYGPYTGVANGKPAIFHSASVKAASPGYNKSKISWSKVSGASGYVLYRATSKAGTYSNIKTVESGSLLSYYDTSLATGTTYYYKVRAYRTVNGKKHYSPYSSAVSIKPTISAVSSIKAATAGYNKNKVSWSKVAGASGYVVYQSTSRNGTYSNVKTVGSSTLSFTRTGLTTGKTYYYKVRAYRTVNGKKHFGPYSSITRTMPVLAKPVSISISKASTTTFKVTWRKASEASGYELYRATSKKGNYTKIKTTASGSTIKFSNKSLVRGKTYYYKVRAYRIVNGKKIYSSFTTISSYKP
ncbi:subtilase family protein [Planomicrobium soli]|uniref:Subtilase family protein n=1 Tax=Planomicrobium soli TaxID=1176648 RepID=A0A2P8H3I5_9BACL|nr:S8 family serine peptidase [Planomicrobium soli]PSL40772.1 subtilase family protein [Planomicrobium soli]